MYYQTRIHEKLIVNSIEEVSNLLIKQKPASYTAINYLNYYFVDDAFIDDPSFSEVAVLIFKDGCYYQFESLSHSALKSNELKDILNNINDYALKTPVKLLFERDPTATAWFNCGCCGCRFFDNVVKQLNYDQDTGYGICEECQSYY